MKLSKIALAFSALVFSGGALAHGFISEPASRDQLCHANEKGLNTGCGQVQYEPQSAGEGPDGFPAAGPADGQLISAGNGALAGNLDAQSSDRWVKHKVEAGPMNITWTFTAPHPIGSIKYYMTKQDWNPNQKLTRDSFEQTPFCETPGVLPAPAAGQKITSECQLPERTGYQVIYAAWDVDDTPSTFYKAIDVQYEDVPSIWKRNIGSIQGRDRHLETGDIVKARVFDAKGERGDLNITLNIDSEAAGDANAWPMALAKKINEKFEDVRAGMKNSEGEVVPASGTNNVYTLADSQIVRVEIQVDAQADKRPAINISDVKDVYAISDAKSAIDFTVQVLRSEMNVVAKAYNEKQENIGSVSVKINDNTQTISLPIDNAAEGKISIVVTGTLPDGKELQKEAETKLLSSSGGDFDFVYPDGIGQYKAGTKVFQPKTKEVFECKNGTVSGWCNILSHHYNPGVGSNWTDAWNKVGASHAH
ncbi:TPA: N-acetylglucosamine-binding protein GbpA [Enterobacter kobei]|nr:N-acetylglucosamine-binding protein GbpA [Enterobacter kobei]HDT4959028.1 N-acetylglucosamine-binding protein GbpA [Enterobacter kobei]